MNNDFLSNKQTIKVYGGFANSGEHSTNAVDTANYDALTFAVMTPPGTASSFTSLQGVKMMESDNADMSNATEVANNKIIGKIGFTLTPTPAPIPPYIPSPYRMASVGVFSNKRYVKLFFTLVSSVDKYCVVYAIADALVVPV